MKTVNCASVLALIAGSLAISTPAMASELSISRGVVTVSHTMLAADDLVGDALLGPVSQQQQQQQQQQVRNLAPLAGIIYTPSNTGFDV